MSCPKHGGNAKQCVEKAEERRTSRAIRDLLDDLDADFDDEHPIVSLKDALRRQRVWTAVLKDQVDQLDQFGLDSRKPSVEAALYAAAIVDLGRLSKLALDAGIDERRMQLEEHERELVASVLEVFVGILAPEVEAHGVQVLSEGWRPIMGRAIEAVATA